MISSIGLLLCYPIFHYCRQPVELGDVDTDVDLKNFPALLLPIKKLSSSSFLNSLVAFVALEMTMDGVGNCGVDDASTLLSISLNIFDALLF
jgi:hypothetical protein